MRAFSLLELIIVVAIIGVLAAMAIPKFSSASENSLKRAVQASLVVLQRQIDHYHAEHDEYPLVIDPAWFRGGMVPANAYASDSSARVVKVVDNSKTHPRNKLLPRSASWWYNLRNGVIRARVKDLGGDSLSLQLYNEVNGSDLAELVPPGDDDDD